MKNLFILFLLLTVSCKTPQKSTQNNSGLSETVSVIITDCPEDGFCALELIPNKSIEFKTDEFGNMYPIISDGTKTLLKYSFVKKPIPNTADSDYQEIVYAELKGEISEFNLTNETLQKVKLTYGRLCFCKGENGYFPIKNGAFSITKNGDNAVNIHLDFSVKKVPKLITELNETVSLKSNQTK